MNDAWQQLSRLPAVERLVGFLRSDNPLLALGVAYREVRWTQFLGWLLEPRLRPARLGAVFLESLLATVAPIVRQNGLLNHPVGGVRLPKDIDQADKSISTINAVEVESREGPHGRADIVVRCALENQPLVVLIENKIQSGEHEQQLQKYVDAELGRMGPSDTLLPILLQLGDEPEETSTCDWAVVLERSHAEAWFRRASARCTAEHIVVPSLVGSYLDLFIAWNDARAIRSEHRKLVEEVRQSDPPADDEWQVISGWLWSGDEPFFIEVLDKLREMPTQQQLAKRNQLAKSDELEAATSGTVLGRNELLQIWKASWTPTRPLGTPESINVHFEARSRGQIQVDVEISPYEGSLNKKPKRVVELKEPLALKARVNQALRDAILNNPEMACLGAHTRYLRSPADVTSCGAVKFERKTLGPDCSVADCAAFYAEVLDRVSPVIDRVIAQVS